MNLWQFLTESVYPLALKVLTSLGIGWVTFEGISIGFDQLEVIAHQYWGTVPADILAIMTLSGFNTGLGTILAALAFRVTFLTVPKLGKVT